MHSCHELLALPGTRLHGGKHARPVLARLREVFRAHWRGFGKHAGQSQEAERDWPGTDSGCFQSRCSERLALPVPSAEMPAISTAPGFEWSVLLAACSTAADPATKRAILVSAFQQPVRWPELSALADLHGVQPLLEQALQIVADRVPAEPLQLLKQRCQSNLHRA